MEKKRRQFSFWTDFNLGKFLTCDVQGLMEDNNHAKYLAQALILCLSPAPSVKGLSHDFLPFSCLGIMTAQLFKGLAAYDWHWHSPSDISSSSLFIPS